MLPHNVENNSSNSSKLHQVIDYESCEVCTFCQVKSVSESHQSTGNNSSVTDEVRQLSMSTGNAAMNAEAEATNGIGKRLVTKSAVGLLIMNQIKGGGC